MTEFNEEWAAQKLCMPKRRRELENYIAKWLPERQTWEPKQWVIDIGCGPGDFLSIFRDIGHKVFGIDDFTGNSPMGKAYTDLCRKHCVEFGIAVGGTCMLESGLDEWRGTVSLVHCRGAIEQIGEHTMTGPPHVEHHDCRRLDWTKESILFLREFLGTCSDLLKPGGILLIAANGTRSTDEMYDTMVRVCGDATGLELVAQDGLLLHKWRKR